MALLLLLELLHLHLLPHQEQLHLHLHLPPLHLEPLLRLLAQHRHPLQPLK